MNYVPIPKGAEPPMLIFETDMEFKQELSKYEHEIHIRTLYAIQYACDTNFEDDITIAFMNDEETILSVPKDCWKENLENTLQYFIDIEDYEKCKEVKQLMDKVE